MQIQTQYSFTVPRDNRGGINFKQVSADLLEAGATVGQYMDIIQTVAELAEIQNVDRDGMAEETKAMLILGVGLKYGPDIIGNPAQCAQVLDAFFNKQWSEVSARLSDLPPEGVALFHALVKRWEPKTETVSMPSGSSLTA